MRFIVFFLHSTNLYKTNIHISTNWNKIYFFAIYNNTLFNSGMCSNPLCTMYLNAIKSTKLFSAAKNSANCNKININALYYDAIYYSELYTTPPSILTLLARVPQKRLAFCHSARRLTAGLWPSAKSNPTVWSLACRCQPQLALRANQRQRGV